MTHLMMMRSPKEWEEEATISCKNNGGDWSVCAWVEGELHLYTCYSLYTYSVPPPKHCTRKQNMQKHPPYDFSTSGYNGKVHYFCNCKFYPFTQKKQINKTNLLLPQGSKPTQTFKSLVSDLLEYFLRVSWNIWIKGHLISKTVLNFIKLWLKWIIKNHKGCCNLIIYRSYRTIDLNSVPFKTSP